MYETGNLTRMAGVGSALQQPQEQTALQVINGRYVNILTEMQNGCNRIDSALSRIMPQPSGAVAPSAKEPEPTGGLHRLEVTANQFDQCTKWLHDLATRLERIG